MNLWPIDEFKKENQQMNRHTFTRAGIAAAATLALSISLASAVQAQARYTCTIGKAEGPYQITAGIDKSSNVFVGSLTADYDNYKIGARRWDVPDLLPTNLNTSSSYAFTSAEAISGSQVVGCGAPKGATQPLITGIYNQPSHALLWNSPSSIVDLHPAGFMSSYAYGVSNGSQVGYSINGLGNHRAMLWRGTAASAVDLTPPGHFWSNAWAISRTQAGNFQVGGAQTFTTNLHAYLWSGTAASGVDLHPVPETPNVFSIATGVSEDMQVGVLFDINVPGYNRAYLWYGSAASAVNLHPAGYTYSIAKDCATWKYITKTFRHQVGYVSGPTTGNNNHAVAWSGNASSMIDLHPLIPSRYGQFSVQFDSSVATGINNEGNIVGYGVGRVVGSSSRFTVPLFWKPIL
jgi:hypothetical protein